MLDILLAALVMTWKARQIIVAANIACGGVAIAQAQAARMDKS